jgi:hypothetical protein
MSAPPPPAAPAPPAAEAALAGYFAAERAASVVFLGCAAAAAAASAALVALGSPYRAMVWPLLAAGLVQLVVGGTIFLRTPGQRARLVRLLRSNPAVYQFEETARMVRVQRRFGLYKRIDVGLLAAGLAFASMDAYGRTLYAIGMGLILEAGLMLALGLRAERRGKRYLRMVKSLD